MALNKVPVSINFSQGLDLKTDPYQVSVGKFLTLQNSVFTAAGRLTKRYGNSNITTLPNALQTTLTTFNDNLIATGSNIYAYNKDNDVWINEGIVQPITLSTIPLIRANTGQINQDAGVAPNGLECLVYEDSSIYYYQILDSSTGQHITARVALPSTASQVRVFVLGLYFIVTYTTSVPALAYVAIPINSPNTPHAPVTVSTALSAQTDGYDGYVINNQLFLSWSASAVAVDICFIDQFLVRSAIVSSTTTSTQQLLSVTADSTRIYVSYWTSSTNNGFSISFDYALNPIMTATATILATEISEIISIVSASKLEVITEVVNSYFYAPTIRTDFIDKYIITPPAVTGVGSSTVATVVLRSVGLGSKPIINNGTVYFVVEYGDTDPALGTDASNQPSYFLIDDTGVVYMRLAYSTSGGYAASQVLPTITLHDGFYYFPYLIVDQLTSTNKTTNPPSGTPVNQITTLTGVNMAVFAINTTQYSSEIAGSLHLTGGKVWQYDGVSPVELGFHVWPENINITITPTGGSIDVGTYFYVFTYEWTDNSGKIHRSAPSIPFEEIVSSATSTATILVPTLRITSKLPPNPVRIVGYRYSLAQPIYYQFTSIDTPTNNDTTVDNVTIVDTSSDAQILGNPILYTTGGIVEDIAPPASIDSALYKNRLFLIDAEDQNLLWFSKVVIENVPVEMSDLLTLYVAPTSGAQGSTGSMTALSAMDDKLIIFKKDAIYYLTGSGPDNTGANSDFSDPVFITASVGCANPNSIVLMPNGLMFQSDKGIWLLDRSLGTNYIGAPVEAFNSNVVLSAQTIPGTNQVRFVLDNDMDLVYDYYFNQWSTFTNIKAISSTLYQSKHTYLNTIGQVFQENTATFLDGSEPVLMSFTTSWFNIAGLQGYERFYFLYLLGTYHSAFKLNVNIAYDYNESPTQSVIVTPDNYVPPYGGEALWGSGGGWGGTGFPFEARVFPTTQKCESFQLIVNEIHDPSLTPNNGQGLTLSGLNMIVGVKKGYRVQKAARSFGG